jgi:hypothetical protein
LAHLTPPFLKEGRNAKPLKIKDSGLNDSLKSARIELSKIFIKLLTACQKQLGTVNFFCNTKITVLFPASKKFRKSLDAEP